MVGDFVSAFRAPQKRPKVAQERGHGQCLCELRSIRGTLSTESSWVDCVVWGVASWPEVAACGGVLWGSLRAGLCGRGVAVSGWGARAWLWLGGGLCKEGFQLIIECRFCGCHCLLYLLLLRRLLLLPGGLARVAALLLLLLLGQAALLAPALCLGRFHHWLHSMLLLLLLWPGWLALVASLRWLLLLARLSRWAPFLPLLPWEPLLL